MIVLSPVACNLQAAIDLTEAQQLDLMHLRRLFYCRISQLLRERKRLLTRVNTDAKELCLQQSPPANADIAKQLRANGLAEYRTYMQFASTFFRGVRSCACARLSQPTCAHQAWISESSLRGSVQSEGFPKHSAQFDGL